MTPFFKDLKVVELANVLAGPAVGLFFAELGAHVVKVENKLTDGDVTRSWKIPSENKNTSSSAYFASVNWNKTSIFVDLRDTADRQQVMELIKDADIVISNYKPGDDEKLQMGYEQLKKINPRLIYAHISGFANASSRTAYDLILQAETGFMYMNGTPESGPLKMPVALIDILAAHQLKEGILIALIKRLQTGKGSRVSASLEHAAIASLANQASNWLMTGYNHQPSGSLHPNIAPYGELFTTADSKKNSTGHRQ
jgi:crotonobetainyl-CoA:carnitine CoA-transferase CaiB-like acyl-CoA transferase